MSLTGNAESGSTLRGKLSGLKTIHGYSAYEIAVINGFRGTEKEWLETIGGEKGRGIEMIEASQDKLIITYTDGKTDTVPVRSSVARVSEITLLSNRWTGSGNLFSQVVAIEGVTENSQVDITPSVEQLVIFYEKDLAFVTENDGGDVTVYAIGQKPANDYTFQITITEVEA